MKSKCFIDLCIRLFFPRKSDPIRRRYIRNPNEEEFQNGKMLIFQGEAEVYDDQDFVPVEIKAGPIDLSREICFVFDDSLGDALLIHGQVVHKSEQSRISNELHTRKHKHNHNIF